MLLGAGQVFAFAVAIHLFALLIGLTIFNRYPEPVKRVLRFTTIFSNCGFMGFPLLQSIYGKSGVFYGSFYVMVFNLFIWTVGIRIFTGKQGPWQKGCSQPQHHRRRPRPCNLSPPAQASRPLYTAMETVASMNTPLSMFLVGATLTEVKPRELFSGGAVYYGSVVRLLLMPFWRSLPPAC